MSFFETALLLAWVAIAVLAFAMAGILRYVHALAERGSPSGRAHSGPLIGRHLSPESAVDLANSDFSILLFVAKSCAICRNLRDELETYLTPEELGAISVVASADGDGWKGAGVRIFENASELFRELDITVTPFAVAAVRGVITDAGRVGSAALLREFVARTREVRVR
jgi:hypothetical protein